MATVTADGAYVTRKCHDAIAVRGAAAVIPPRKNAKPWKMITAGAASRYEPGQKTIRGIVFPAIGCIVLSLWANGPWRGT
jgi:hypothetical protein